MKLNFIWVWIINAVISILKNLKPDAVFVKLCGKNYTLACYAIEIIIDVLNVSIGRLTWQELLAEYFQNDRTLSIDQHVKRSM